MTLLERVLQIGVSPDTPSELAVILRTANVVNALVAIVFIAFTVLFAFVAPELIVITVVGIVNTVVAVFLLSFGYDRISRILTSVGTPLAAVFFYVAISGPEHPLPMTFAACIGITIFPWFLFTQREAYLSFIGFSVNLGFILSHNIVRGFTSFSGDYHIIQTEVLQVFILIAAMGVVAAVIYGLQSNNGKEAEKVRGLLQQRDAENVHSMEKEAELNRLLKELQVAQEEEKKHTWATHGIAEAGKMIRDEQDRQRLADKIVAFLVKYLNANQGALFLTVKDEAGNTFFELTGCYAYNRKKYLEKKIDISDGLLGECFQSREPIYITQVPAQYVHITSGLGEATPRCLLLVPVMTADSVFGVMEFASFNTFEPHVISFLLDVGENMATAFHNLHVASHTGELLKETQEMAEQMRAQEEEMRQNMEELAATQEQQMRMEQELRTRLEEKEREIAALRAERNASRRTIIA